MTMLDYMVMDIVLLFMIGVELMTVIYLYIIDWIFKDEERKYPHGEPDARTIGEVKHEQEVKGFHRW